MRRMTLYEAGTASLHREEWRTLQAITDLDDAKHQLRQAMQAAIQTPGVVVMHADSLALAYVHVERRVYASDYMRKGPMSHKEGGYDHPDARERRRVARHAAKRVQLLLWQVRHLTDAEKLRKLPSRRVKFSSSTKLSHHRSFFSLSAFGCRFDIRAPAPTMPMPAVLGVY